MIDVLKLVCALLVIVVHVPPLGEHQQGTAMVLNDVLQYGLARIAVPFYFVCTGFLHFRRAGEGKTVLESSWRYVKKLFRLYIVWTVMYAPFILRDILMNEQGILAGVVTALRDFFLVGSYVHLWYLHATMVAVLLVALLLAKKIPLGWIMGLAAVLYGAGLLAQSYFGMIQPLAAYPAVWQALKALQRVILTTRNGLFEGFAFVALGALLARKPIQLGMKKAALGLAGALILLVMEITVLEKLGWIREHDYYISLLPIAFFMVYLAAHVRLDQEKICRWMRSVASLIFFVHIWVRGALILLSGFLGLGWTENAMLFVLTVMISAGVAVLWERLARTKRFAWLHKLY